MPEEPKKRRFWELDPSVFQPGRKATLVERIVQPLRSAAKYVLYLLALLYPLSIITIGIVFGGLVFWTVFVGSVTLIGLIIKKAGYSRNFQSWDLGLRKFLVLTLAFLGAFGFWEGLFILKTWMLAVFAGVFAVGLFFLLRRQT